MYVYTYMICVIIIIVIVIVIIIVIIISRRFRVTRYADDNVRIYKTVPMKLPKGWRGDLNYSSRTKDGRDTYTYT